jgi:phosphoglycerate dehydrogenase-like enzyme
VNFMKVVKKYIKKVIAHTSGRTGGWGKSTGMRILIHSVEGFEKELWESMIDRDYRTLLNETDIRFTDSKREFLKLIGRAEAIFAGDIEDVHLAKKALFYQVPLTGIDYAECFASSNVPVVTSQGLASRSVAEYVLSFILFHAKQIRRVLDDKTNRRWSQEHYFHSLQMLESLNVCILGYGSIGKEIASILGSFQIKLFIVENNYDTFHTSSGRRTYYKSIEEVPVSLDYLIVTIPLQKSTKHLVDRKYFEKIGHHGILMNVSRGDVLNEKDLIYALQNHRLGGAVLDVQSEEPMKKTSPFWDCPNLLITPHISGNIYFIRENIMKRFLNNILAAGERRILEGRVNL